MPLFVPRVRVVDDPADVTSPLPFKLRSDAPLAPIAKAAVPSCSCALFSVTSVLANQLAALSPMAISPPVTMSALAFSHQISKDTERNSAAVPLRYKGRSFTIVGTVDYVIRDGEFYRVAFKVPNPWEEPLRHCVERLLTRP